MVASPFFTCLSPLLLLGVWCQDRFLFAPPFPSYRCQSPGLVPGGHPVSSLVSIGAPRRTRLRLRQLLRQLLHSLHQLRYRLMTRRWPGSGWRTSCYSGGTYRHAPVGTCTCRHAPVGVLLLCHCLAGQLPLMADWTPAPVLGHLLFPMLLSFTHVYTNWKNQLFTMETWFSRQEIFTPLLIFHN